MSYFGPRFPRTIHRHFDRLWVRCNLDRNRRYHYRQGETFSWNKDNNTQTQPEKISLERRQCESHKNVESETIASRVWVPLLSSSKLKPCSCLPGTPDRLRLACNRLKFLWLPPCMRSAIFITFYDALLAALIFNFQQAVNIFANKITPAHETTLAGWLAGSRWSQFQWFSMLLNQYRPPRLFGLPAAVLNLFLYTHNRNQWDSCLRLTSLSCNGLQF